MKRSPSGKGMLMERSNSSSSVRIGVRRVDLLILDPLTVGSSCAVKCCNVTRMSVFGQGEAEEQLINGVGKWSAFPKDIRRCIVVSDPFLSMDRRRAKADTLSGVGYGMDNMTDSIAVRGNISGQISEC